MIYVESIIENIYHLSLCVNTLPHLYGLLRMFTKNQLWKQTYQLWFFVVTLLCTCCVFDKCKYYGIAHHKLPNHLYSKNVCTKDSFSKIPMTPLILWFSKILFGSFLYMKVYLRIYYYWPLWTRFRRSKFTIHLYIYIYIYIYKRNRR